MVKSETDKYFLHQSKFIFRHDKLCQDYPDTRENVISWILTVVLIA